MLTCTPRPLITRCWPRWRWAWPPQPSESSPSGSWASCSLSRMARLEISCSTVQAYVRLPSICFYPCANPTLVLYVSAAVVYVYSAVPKLSRFTNLTPFAANLPRFPASLRQPTVELASSHLICAVALTGVLILQAAKYWSEGEEDDGHLDSRVDSSEGNWKRSPRPVEPTTESSATRQTRSRNSQSPTARRRSPVKRKVTAGSSTSQTR
jgi:hypothetical protein